jgi:hypothetical protein
MTLHRIGSWMRFITVSKRFMFLTAPLITCLLIADRLEGAPKAKAETVVVRDVSGKAVKPLAGKDRRATLVFFIAHDCPISNAYAPEIGRICKAYDKKRVSTYVVYVEKDLKPADARKHARDFGYPCPALFDRERRLVKLTGAKMTPEAVLISPQSKVVYRGRIDDLYVAYGKHRQEPSTRDLRRALDAYLSNKPVKPDRTPVIGCYIPDL